MTSFREMAYALDDIYEAENLVETFTNSSINLSYDLMKKIRDGTIHIDFKNKKAKIAFDQTITRYINRIEK